MEKFKFLKSLGLNLLFSLFFTGLLFAEDAVLNFGGKYGWNNLLSSSNIQVQNGKFGHKALRLSSSAFSHKAETDAYISFDYDKPIEETGSYTLKNYSTIKTEHKKAKYGEGAGFFSTHSKSEAIKLEPKEDAFFFGNSPMNSFTIDFWLYPQTTENGSIILKWWSSLSKNKKTMYQNITASIIHNKLEWSFLNIWFNKNKGLDLKLSGNSNIVPEQWTHHLITYNEDTGILEYRMNGKTEDIIYLTETGHENAQILDSMLGVPSPVFLGVKYSGLMDEFKITKQFTETKMPWETSALFEKFPLEGGRIETNIIEVGGKKSIAKKLDASFFKPKQTDLEFFIRAADNPFNWDDSNPEWKAILPDSEIKDVSGRFFQIACNIYPDSDGAKTPLLNSFSLHYEKDTQPFPPTKIIAKAMDGAVKLSWSPSVNFDTKGYMIFVGEKKGEYFCKDSPKDVGNVLEFKIDNLKNGKIYFFAIAAYDDEEKTLGHLSKEVWARPLKSKTE